MPWIEIRHTTVYKYASAISLGPHQMMLRPHESRSLRLVSFDLDVSPDARIDWSYDVAGNAVAVATFDGTTDMLEVNARTVVDLKAPVWPVFPIAAHALSYPFLYSEDDIEDLGSLASPRYRDDTGRLSDWVEGFVMQRPTDTLSLLKAVANGVSEQISYQSREIEGTQGPLKTLELGRGSLYRGSPNAWVRCANCLRLHLRFDWRSGGFGWRWLNPCLGRGLRPRSGMDPFRPDKSRCRIGQSDPRCGCTKDRASGPRDRKFSRYGQRSDFDGRQSER